MTSHLLLASDFNGDYTQLRTLPSFRTMLRDALGKGICIPDIVSQSVWCISYLEDTDTREALKRGAIHNVQLYSVAMLYPRLLDDPRGMLQVNSRFFGIACFQCTLPLLCLVVPLGRQFLCTLEKSLGIPNCATLPRQNCWCTLLDRYALIARQ